MNKYKKIKRIEDKCRDIININMWYELPDSIFWSIADVMDGSNDEFAINAYKNITKNSLQILLHPPILLSLIESLQSDSLLEYISKLCERERNFDKFLLSDAESCLFINYEDDSSETAESFNKIYGELKDIVKLSRKHIHDDKSIFDNLDKIKNYSKENKHNYFSYVRAYWLSLYFCDISQKVGDKDKLSSYQDELSILFPNVFLYNKIRS